MRSRNGERRSIERVIKTLGQITKFDHEVSNRLFVDAGVFTRPVVFVSEPPENDRGMVVVPIDQVSQHILCLLLKRLTSYFRTTPWNLFSHHQAKLIAKIEDQPILLVVAKTDEVCPHLPDELHLLPHQVVAHRGCHLNMIRMALRATQQEPPSVQLERTMLDKLNMANTKSFLDTVLFSGTGESNGTTIEVRRLGGPELRPGRMFRSFFTRRIHRKKEPSP